MNFIECYIRLNVVINYIKKMKILFIGKNYGNSKLSYNAIKKIHSKTEFLATENILSKIEHFIFYNFFPNLFNHKINEFYEKKIIKKYDLFFFYNNEYVNENLISKIKENNSKAFYYCGDNPFVNRDRKRWKLLIKVIDKFDLVIFQQKNRIKYVKKFNIKKYITILPPYFKNAHVRDNKKPKKNIIFFGTWFPERGKFFYELIKLGIKIDIYGPRWNKDKKYYKYLKPHIHLNTYNAQQFANIISNYKIAIALYSKENDDDLSNRSIEIPAIGSLICSQKSKTLEKILIANKEAIYFNTPNECFKKCLYLLNNEKIIDKIRINGQKKILKILRPEAQNVFKKILTPNLLKKNNKKFIINY